MAVSNRSRLHKLCSRALAETDPDKFAALLGEIDEVLSQTMTDLNAMLKDVERVLRRTEVSSRIHLA